MRIILVSLTQPDKFINVYKCNYVFVDFKLFPKEMVTNGFSIFFYL